MAWSIEGEGSIGPPSAHIFSFQLWQSKSSASRMSASPAARAFRPIAAQGSLSSLAPGTVLS
jgi:hypothetical protein